MSSLYPAPLTAILAAIAAQNKGVTLVPAQYTFGNPTPYSDPLGRTNTSLLITVSDVTSPYQGSQTVNYTRLNLADLATLLPQPIPGNGWVTVADFWAALNANYGLNFAAGDLNDATPLVIGAGGTGTVTLVAQPNSMGWIGQVTLTFIGGNYNLKTFATVTALPGLLYPNQDATKPFGELYSYWRDMTTWQSDLQSIPLGASDLTQLCTDLTACTGNTWTNTVSGRYSLQGAVVAYNGTVKGFTPIAQTLCTPNPAYTYVLVIHLGSGSLGYSGYLFLHYGLINPYANSDGPAVKTSLLLHFDGINGSTTVVDNVKPSRVLTDNAPAVISTAQSVFGGSSLYIPASGSIVTPDSPELQLSGDFTVEFEVFPLNVAGNQAMLCKGAGGCLYMSGGVIYVNDDTASVQISGGGLTQNVWNNVALSKSGSTTALFVNGVLVATSTTFGTFGVNSGSLYIGTYSDGSLQFSGFVDEVRISTVARYTATFTPSDIPFVVD